jgi:flagellar motor component MotA
MTRDEFMQEYTNVVGRALAFAEKSRRQGLLALEEEMDEEKFNERDVFEYGLRFVVDGTDKESIEKILSNLVNQEKDEYKRILKTMQKEAVLMIQDGTNPRVLYSVINSYTDISLKEDTLNVWA